MENHRQTLREEMKTTQLKQKENYDQHRKPDHNLKSGDMVWFIPRNVKTTRPSKKLDYKKLGPFKIINKVGTSSYKLDLPTSMRIHNTFHLSLIELYKDNKFPSQIQTPPPPIEIEEEPEYDLEEIMDYRLYRNKLQYRAKWTGYSPEHDKTWYPAGNFNNANRATEQFHSRYPRKPRLGTRNHQQVSLRGSPAKGEENPTPPPATTQEEWTDNRFLPHSATPTSPPYSGPVEAKEQRRVKKAALHPGLNWASCYDDECPVHLSEKQGQIWFPRKPSKKRKE